MYSLQENDSFFSNPRFLHHQIKCKPYVRWMCIGEKHKNLNFQKKKKPAIVIFTGNITTAEQHRKEITIVVPRFFFQQQRETNLYFPLTNTKQQKWPSMSDITSPFDKRRERERERGRKRRKAQESANTKISTKKSRSAPACWQQWAKMRTGRQASWLVSTEAFQELLLQTST